MAVKPRTKNTSLAFMGEGWDQAYIENRMMVDEDQQRLDAIQSDKAMTDPQKGKAILKLFFVSGKGPNDQNELVDMTLEDIDAFDIFTVGELVNQVGMPDPKASATSMPTSEGMDQPPGDSSPLPIESDLA